MASKVQDIDKGFKRLAALFALQFIPNVRVGVQGKEAAEIHQPEGKQLSLFSQPLTNARLAAIHEFGASINHPGGTPFVLDSSGQARFVKKGTSVDPGNVTRPHRITIPERSFIRSTTDENADKYANIMTKAAERIIDGKLSFRKAAALLGEKAVSDIKRKISSGLQPPLKPSTIRKRKRDFGKSSSKPLLATGQLRNSITFRVVDEPASVTASPKGSGS